MESRNDEEMKLGVDKCYMSSRYMNDTAIIMIISTV
jgi:hypothetical protein